MNGNGKGGRKFDLIETLESRRLLSAAVQGVLPTISIADAQTAEGNRGVHGVAVVVSLSQASSRPVSVQFKTVDGTALAGSDYLARTGAITFRPGQTSKSVKINVIGDTVQEADESFLVNLRASRGGTIDGQANSAIVTIINDDAANPSRPAVFVADAVFSEANDGAGFKNNYFFPVELSAPTDHDVTISYHSTDGTAKAAHDAVGVDGDYEPISGSLTIPAGQSKASIPVQIVNDLAQEPTRTFTLHVIGVKGAMLAGDVARRNLKGVILDNDGPTTGTATLYYGQDWGQSIAPQSVGQAGLYDELNRVNVALLDGGLVQVKSNQIVVVPPVQQGGTLLLANTGGPPVAIVSGTPASFVAVGSGTLQVLTNPSIQTPPPSTSQIEVQGNSMVINYSASDDSHAVRDTIRNLLANARNGSVTNPGWTIDPVGSSGSVQQEGSGTLVLSGSNNYAGSATISAGTLTTAGGGTLQLSGVATAGSATITGGTISFGSQLSLVDTPTTNGGTVSITNPSLNTGGSVANLDSNTLTVTQGAILDATGAGTSIMTGGGTLNLFNTGSSGAVLTISGGGTTSSGSLLDGGTSFMGLGVLTNSGGTINSGVLLLDSGSTGGATISNGGGTTSPSTPATSGDTSTDTQTPGSTDSSTTPVGSNLFFNAAVGLSLASGPAAVRSLLSRLRRRRQTGRNRPANYTV